MARCENLGTASQFLVRSGVDETGDEVLEILIKKHPSKTAISLHHVSYEQNQPATTGDFEKSFFEPKSDHFLAIFSVLSLSKKPLAVPCKFYQMKV